MSSIPFMLKRYPFFSLSQLERLQETAIRILVEVGIKVHQENLRDFISSRGFRVRKDRILFDRDQVLSFINSERNQHGHNFSQMDVEYSGEPIVLSVSPYPQSIHDLDSDEVVPFTSERLIQATKLADALSDWGVRSGAPGCPTDVPPALQPVKQYWIAATYSRFGQHPVDAKSAITMPYVMDMSDALGYPIRGLPVYVFSPLNLGGESLNCVFQFKDRLQYVGVSNMVSVGCAAPVQLGNAYAMSVAEVVGSAIIVRELTGLNVHWSVRLCPFDMRGLAMSLGSPEDALFQMTDSEVNAFFHGTQWWQAIGSIHTASKLPDAQAATEKSSLMTVGAIMGARHFSGAGTLSLDEVFSAEQLIIDCEIRDHVQRLVSGVDIDCDPQSCIDEILQGIDRGFIGLDTTLDNYKKIYWHPRFFERRFLAPWQGDRSPTIRKKIRLTIDELTRNHNYSLDIDVQKELDKIYAKAESKLKAL